MLKQLWDLTSAQSECLETKAQMATNAAVEVGSRTLSPPGGRTHWEVTKVMCGSSTKREHRFTT